MRAVRLACDWLAMQASKHGVSLDLILEPGELLVMEDAGAVSALRRPDRWRAYRYEEDRLLQEIERRRADWAQTVWECVRRLPVTPNHVCLIVHTTGRGVGFALPARNDLQREADLELCVCGRGSAPAVYAHELLHLFGATDLYVNPWWILTRKGETDEARRQLEFQFVRTAFEIVSASCWNSIMGSAWPGVEYLTIDSLTARAIGWRKPDEPYMQTAVQRERAIGEALAGAIEKTMGD